MLFCVHQFTNATRKKPTGPYPLLTNLDVYSHIHVFPLGTVFQGAVAYKQ